MEWMTDGLRLLTEDERRQHTQLLATYYAESEQAFLRHVMASSGAAEGARRLALKHAGPGEA